MLQYICALVVFDNVHTFGYKKVVVIRHAVQELPFWKLMVQELPFWKLMVQLLLSHKTQYLMDYVLSLSM